MSRAEFLRSCCCGAGLLVLGGISSAGGESLADGLPLVLRETDRFDTRMEKTRGLAIDASDRLHVAGQSGVQILDASRKSVKHIQTDHAATCVCVDTAGYVFVGSEHRVEVFDADGRKIAAFGESGRGETELGYVTALAVWDDLLYLADAGNRRISRFALDGDCVDSLGDFSIPSPYFDLTFDADGRLVVGHTARHAVETYDRNWRKMKSWGEYGDAPNRFTGCCNPTNLAVLPDGRIVTTEKGIPRLKVSDADGNLLAFCGEEAFHPKTAGMDVVSDSKGRILLLDPMANQVRVYELFSAGKAERR
jgi:hypothetical protein